MIFKWRMEGMGVAAIARRLNDRGIPTQLLLRYMEGYQDGKKNALWRGSSVADLLENPYYLGCTVERKERKSLYKGGEKEVLPKPEWNLIENTHEPIIDKQMFEEVGRRMADSKRKRRLQLVEKSYRQKTENILSGKIRCGLCGRSVFRSGGYFRKDGSLVHYSFYCSGKYIKKYGCRSQAVNENELHDAVFQACRIQLELLDDRKEKQCHTESGRLKDARKLTKEMCSVMVKKIVWKENTIHVHFTFTDEYERALAVLYKRH
ncbi:MAG: recombinase family protein [Lachnospiraceae bacterium]|nr:recombinase family protein [Lachnospiraceae bacterium]